MIPIRKDNSDNPIKALPKWQEIAILSILGCVFLLAPIFILALIAIVLGLLVIVKTLWKKLEE